MKSNTQMGYGALAIAGLCLLLGSVANAAPTGKIEICHKPGERNQRILSINEEKDGEKHFGHDDYRVSLVPICDNIPDNDCDGKPDDPNLDTLDCTIREDDGDAMCVDGECVVPPPACPCANIWAGNNDHGMNFPIDVTGTLQGIPGTCETGPIYQYYDNQGAPGLLFSATIDVQNKIACGIQSFVYDRFTTPTPDDDLEACIRYVEIESNVQVLNGCLTD